MLDRPLGVSLRRLLPHARFVGVDDIRVTSCAGDSRRCQPGDLFVALRGTRHDGHAFVDEAVTRGATALLCERPVEGTPLPICLVPDARVAYGRLCQALVGNPSSRLKIIGITGTNGKTTTSWLVANVLSAAGYHCGVLGTLGYYDGFEFEPATHTTPTPPQLARQLARMEAAGCTHVAMEVSSHALAQARIAGIQLDVAAVTQVGRDHLDYHGSLAEYHRAKRRLFEHVSDEGLAIVNVDDAVAAGFLEGYQGPALSVGMDGPSEISATPLERFLSEQTFLLSAGDETVPVRTHLIGDHNIYNCLIAAAVGFVYDLDLPTIVRGLEAVSCVPGRLERIECGQPFGVFVDYAHTPDALTHSLNTLRGLTRGRVICVFGAGGERDREKRPLMATAVERVADLAVITNDNPRNEDPKSIADDLLRGFERRSRVQVVLDRAEAIAWALAQCRPGDCLLLAGKGHEDYQIIGENRLEFDDREVARSWLYENWPPQPMLRASA